MSPVTIGTEIEIVDELAPVVAPTATDTLFLLHSDVPDLVTLNNAADAREEFTGFPDLIAMSDAYFAEGGAKLVAAPLQPGSGDDIVDALDQFPADLGPGQLAAPEVNVGADMADVAEFAYRANRIYLADGPAGADDAALGVLADAIRASEGARFAAVMADTLLIPGLAPSTTRDVPASVVQAALMARIDTEQGNPNLAAAGLTNARGRYVIGIESERTETQRNALADKGINAFRTVYGAIVPYGYRTTADPDDLPVWWDLAGSRTVMAVRAREAAVAEAHMFGQIDGEGAFLASYEAGLARELKDLQNIGALFGSGPADPGYSVKADWTVNPRSEVAQGRVASRIRLRTSPLAEYIGLTIIRRPVTAAV